MARDRTTVEIERSTWKQLNALKEPGDSFNDVIQRLLDGDGSDDEPEEVTDGGGGPFPMTCGCGTRLEDAHDAHDHIGECDELGSQ